MVGVLGLAAGFEAIYYTSEVGPSGDDFTGLASLAAGMLLLGLGAVTLWRTRRTDGSRVWRYPRRVLLGVAGVVGAGVLMRPVVLGYATTHVGRAVVPPERLGVAHEDVRFTTADGLELEGWYVPSKERRGRDRAAVVSEGAGARSLTEDMDYDRPAVEKWTVGVAMSALKTATIAVSSNRMPPANLKDLAARIDEPLFLIAAPEKGVGEELNRGYAKAAGESATLWEIPEATHVGGLEARPEEYERRVLGFFDAALTGDGAPE